MHNIESRSIYCLCKEITKKLHKEICRNESVLEIEERHFIVTLEYHLQNLNYYLKTEIRTEIT